MNLSCPGTVSTDAATGAVLCQDGTGAAVQWVVVPDFDLTQLDQGQITSYFSWGWFIVFLGWATGKGVSVFIKFLKSV